MNRWIRRLAPEHFGRAIRPEIFVALLIALVVVAPADAQITRGAISGSVRDTTGALVPGATVTVVNVNTNISRTAVTDSNGFYRVAALEPGRYTVKTELAGFSTVENNDVTVRTASEVTLNVDLRVAGMGEAITVTGKAEAIELNKVNPNVGLTTTTRQATELPLGAARNVNDMVLLAPNAVSVAGAGQGSYSVNGSRSRNNNYTIDGSDNNDISVTIATTQIVPESVAEFQVVTNPYTVEFGRNTGAQINVITKSGTNSFRGEVWDYYRASGLGSMSNIEKDQGRTDPARLIRHQMGANIGGPIFRDRTFFFLLYQHDTQRPAERPSPTTVRVPTPAGFARLSTVPLRAGQPASSRQAVLQRINFLQDLYAQNLSFRNLTNTLVNGVPVETGQTNINIVDPSTYKTILARIDHRIGDSDNLTFRYSLNDRVDENAISNLGFGPLFAGNQDLVDSNIGLSETHMFSSNLLNEFRFSWVKRDLDFPENDPESPTATITGLFTIGGASNFPQFRVSDQFQFSDALTWTKNRHTLKFGADVRYNKLDNGSAFDSKGTFTFNSLQDYMNNQASTLAQALQTSSFLAKQWQVFGFVQDDFRVTPELTLNLGLRYELSSVPLDFFGATDPQSLGALVPGPVKMDKNNWAPRVGFAWSPNSSSPLLGNGKTVFRGGFGIGYDQLFYNLLVVNASNFPRVVVARPTNVLDQYPNLLPATATAVFSPTAAFTNSDENTQHPSARYFSLSVQREVSDFVVELGYTGSRSYHGINQIDVNPAIITPEQIALVASTRNPNAIPQVQARRLNPQFGTRVRIPSDVGPNGVDTEARAQFDAGFISVNKRLAHGLQFGVSYTLSRFMSNNDASLGEGGTGDTGSSQRPQSYFDIESEWSRSQFDRPHRFVVNWIWELPGPKSGPLSHVIGGWQLSGILAGQSGRPFTVVTGVDSSGDGNTGSDRPNFNPSGTLTWSEGNKTFTNNGRYSAPLGTNNLPLQNGLGNGNAPRNGERGAGFWNTDLSLLKRFKLGAGGREFHVRVDAFNAFNQDNYGNPNGNMSNPGFGTNTNNWGRRIVVLSGKVQF